MRNIIFILIAFIINSIIIAQSHSIEGKVVDKKDNQPLIGVNVLIDDLKIGTSTNEDGLFEFGNIKPGNYSLKISYIGHKTIIKDVTVPLSEKIYVEMEEGTVNLREVVITGNPLAVDPKDISQSTLSIANLELQIKRGSNIGQSLNFQPGISMRSNGTASARPVIRGFSNNRILILENGLRMGDLSNTSDDHGVTSDGSTPEKIEVLRGPASLLYGSNAIGGVINIITEEIPNYIPNGLDGIINFSGSSNNNEVAGSADIHFGIDRFALHGNYFNRKSKDYNDGNGVMVNNSDQNSNGYQFGFSFFPDFGLTGLSYKNFETKYGIPTATESEKDDEEGPIQIDMNKKEYRFLFESNKLNFFIENLSLKSGYQDYTHKEIIRNTGEVGTSFGLKSIGFDLSLKHRQLFDNLQGVFGIWYQAQEYTVNGDEAFTPNADYSGMAAYILEQIQLNNINLQFGIRFEKNGVDIPGANISDTFFPAEEKNFNSLSGSFGIVYSITEQISAFSNIANAFRAPTIEELSSYAVHEATGTFDIGNRNLDKENNVGIDVGLRVRKENHLVELSAYYNSINNYIYRMPTTLFYQPDNSGNSFNDSAGIAVYKYSQTTARLYGFELKAQYEFTNYLSTTIVLDYVNGQESDTDKYLPQIPPFRFSIEQRYMTDEFWAGIQWKVSAEQKLTAEGELPTKGFGLVDIYCGTKFFTGSYIHMFSLKINNLLDQPYKEHLSAIKEFAYMPGRDIQLNYKFLF
ncbi:MAG: TonB-dependent receptor [Bacteroidota bacterium]